MSELQPELVELCRAHEIGVELIEAGGDSEQVVDRLLAECESQLQSGAANSEAGLHRLLGLVLLARRTRSMQPEASHESGSSDREGLQELFGELARQCHKINNPLTAVMGRAQILLLKLGKHDDPKMGEAAEVIQESSRRVADRVQELAHMVQRARDRFQR